MVLQKELPEFVKRSSEAYIGCLAGAIMEEEYLEIIRSAGFQDVTVAAQSGFPVETLISETTASVITEKPIISPEQQKEVADSVVSIKVSAFKPA